MWNSRYTCNKVSVKAGHSLEFVENIYQLTSEIVHLNAVEWLRMSNFHYLVVMPDLAEPPQLENSDLSDKYADRSDYLSDLCRLPLMQEHPMLADCLRSHAKTIRMLKRMGLADCAWHQNLLIAMDDDADFEEFLQMLYKVYSNEQMTASTKSDYTSFTTVKSWEAAVSYAEKFSLQPAKKHTDILLVIDSNRAGFENDDTKIRAALQSISKMNKNFLCIIRTQVFEVDLIERMLDDINDIIPAGAIVVPPASTDVLLNCFKSYLGDKKCSISPDCDDLIEQWIIQEAAASGISGYELVKRLALELILRKAQGNIKSGIPTTIITREDLLQCVDGNIVESTNDTHSLLNSMIGLAQIKQRVLEIAAQIKVQKELAKEGVDRPAIHMMFTGNPGTGKTMVARIIASILREEGVLSKGHLYEVNARDLCAQHIGHTAPKVAAKCRDAYGSVLFVDEAYTLYQVDSDRDSGKEAIAALMTEMENHRDDFCVILAGYPDDMEQLMTANSGLRSRIPYTIQFPNYSREELTEIFFRMLDGHFVYDESLKTAVEDFFNSLSEDVMTSADFSRLIHTPSKKRLIGFSR